MVIYCCKCGKQIPENAKYCPYCGEEVLINRGNPEAVEVKPEEVKQEVVESPAASEDEVRSGVQDEYNGHKDELIAKYEDEIKTFEHRRKAMAIPGGIILGLFFIASFVISILISREYYSYIVEIINSTDSSDIPDQIPQMLVIYLALLSIFSILSDGGLALLLVGIIPNSIKITKRKNRIDQMKGLR